MRLDFYASAPRRGGAIAPRLRRAYLRSLCERLRLRDELAYEAGAYVPVVERVARWALVGFCDCDSPDCGDRRSLVHEVVNENTRLWECDHVAMYPDWHDYVVYDLPRWRADHCPERARRLGGCVGEDCPHHGECYPFASARRVGPGLAAYDDCIPF